MSDPAPTDEEALEQLRLNTPLWCDRVGKIIDKETRATVPFHLNEAQRQLCAALEAQRLAGKPQRAIVLKARQIGCSTLLQAKAIQRATLIENHSAMVVAHDKEAAQRLFRIGERFYDNLPGEFPQLKPPKLSHRRGNFLHFADEDSGGPDSTYLVDTAGEKESGRSGSYDTLHLSEVALYPIIEDKLNSLLSAVTRSPESLVVLESTARGNNEFKDRWDRAVEGNNYIAFFWPWWKQPEYVLPFANDAERDQFERELGTGPYGEAEPGLLDPGPYDTMSKENVPLTLEQLHWRRDQILNEFGGKLDKFRQEMPATPEEAFISSGRQVFEPQLVQVIVNATDFTDPRTPTVEFPGPEIGQFRPASSKRVATRGGPQDIPASSLWVPKSELSLAEDANWKLWLDAPEITDGKPTGQFILASDVSGRVEEYDGDEPAWDTIQIIGHKSRLQVAEWRGRCDADQLAEQILLACLHFNRPWAAPEVTGGYGGPVARKLFMDFKYPYVYKRKSHGTTQEGQLDRLGWDTNRQTKPLLDANLAGAIRDGTHGIRSRALAMELTTYIKDSRGRTRPEKGKFSDLLMAYSIAQMVADIQPVKKSQTGRGFDPPVSY